MYTVGLHTVGQYYLLSGSPYPELSYSSLQCDVVALMYYLSEVVIHYEKCVNTIACMYSFAAYVLI